MCSNTFRCVVSAIEGTLELSELYSCMEGIYSPDDIQQPEFDDKPNEDDVKFMQRAYEVSERTPDESTKVHRHTSYIAGVTPLYYGAPLAGSKS